MDGNIKDTPPIIVVPQRGRPPRLGRARQANWPRRTQQLEARKTGRPRRLRRLAGRGRAPKTLADRRADRRAARCTPPLDEGDGKTIDVDRRRPSARRAARRRRRPGQPGHVGRKALHAQQGRRGRAGRRRRLRAATSRSPCAAWVKLAADDADRRDPAPAWTTASDYRGWDLWLEGRPRRHAHRQQVAGRRAQGRRQDAAASRNEWTHVAVTYDGSGKAGGREGLRQRRAAADRRRRPTSCKGTIRTTVPFKLGQRHTSEPARRRRACRTCGSTTGALPPARSSRWPSRARSRRSLAEAGRPSGPTPRRTSCSTGGWQRSTSRTKRARRRSSAALEQEQAAIKARGTIAHVMQEKTEPSRWRSSCSAASTTSAATR